MKTLDKWIMRTEIKDVVIWGFYAIGITCAILNLTRHQGFLYWALLFMILPSFIIKTLHLFSKESK